MKSILFLPGELIIQIMFFLNNYELKIIIDYIEKSKLIFDSINLNHNKVDSIEETSVFTIKNIFIPLNSQIINKLYNITNSKFFNEIIDNRNHPIVFNCLENYCELCNSRGNIFFKKESDDSKKKGQIKFLQCFHV